MPSRSKKSSACTIPDAPSSVVAEPPAAYYTRAKEPMFFFGQPVTRGTFLNGVRANVTPAHDSAPDPHLFYKHPNGELWTGDSILLHFRKTRDFTFNTDSVRFLATLNGWRGSQGWRRGSRAWR